MPALGIAWVGDAFTYAEQYTQQRKVGNDSKRLIRWYTNLGALDFAYEAADRMPSLGRIRDRCGLNDAPVVGLDVSIVMCATQTLHNVHYFLNLE